MPKFYYVAIDKSGKKIQGSEELSSQEELVNRLQDKQLVVVSVSSKGKEAGEEAKFETGIRAAFKPRHFRVTRDDLMLFCRQLSTLLGAGVTILKSLDIIAKQVSSRNLLSIIRSLQKDMEQGLSLHESMVKHPTVFSDLWVNLVESGEASGNLSVVLARLASYLERNAAFINKVVSALIYPVILLVAGSGALLFLNFKIIPVFAELFKGFNVRLPMLTEILFKISNVLRHSSLIIFGTIAGAFFLIRAYIRTKEGRIAFERFLFSMPIMGEFFRALVVERFSSEMSTLIEGGVPILYSLEITEHSCANLVLGEIIHKVKEEVRSGRPLHYQLEKSGFFDPMFVQMVSIGEEIGELSQMFKKINAFYQEMIETYLIRFTAMFEPIMLLFMGVVIGIMVIGMFLPIFRISQIGGG